MAMHFYIYHHCSMRLLDGLHFYLALVRAALLGFGREAAYPPMCLLIFSSTVGIFPLMCLLLHGAWSDTLVVRGNYCGTGYSLECLPLIVLSSVFGGGLRSVLRKLMALSMLPGLGIMSWSSRRYKLLLPVCLFIQLDVPAMLDYFV